MSRQGRHKPGKVSIGIYIEEEKRALLAYLVDLTGMTATDIIMEGVMAKAKTQGIFDDAGKILPEHQAAINVIVEAYRMEPTKRKSTSKKGN